MRNQSVNIINGTVLLKQLLGETLLFFEENDLETVRSVYVEILNSSEL